MQIQTERGLVAIDETITVHSAEEARLAGFSYAWHSDKLHCDLYSKSLDDEGHLHVFIRLVDLENLEVDDK